MKNFQIYGKKGLIIVGLAILLSACGYKETAEIEKEPPAEVWTESCPTEVRETERGTVEKIQTWQEAYLDILYHLQENLVPLYEPDGSDSRKFFDGEDMSIYLGLHDFDEDGTLELIAGDTFSLAVFTYREGQAEKIADLYYPDIVWCINGVHFKDHRISLNCDGAGGSDFVNFGYVNGEYVLGRYSELNPDTGITVNGVESTYEEVNQIYTLDWKEREQDAVKEWVRLVREEEVWILKYQSGEEVVLDSNFDFDTILW